MINSIHRGPFISHGGAFQQFFPQFSLDNNQNNQGKSAEVEEPRENSMPRFVNYAADYSGCGHWRILWPEVVINSQGKGISQTTTSMVLDPNWYRNVKCVKVQRQANSHQKRFVEHLREIRDKHNLEFKIHYEVDDVVFREVIPDYNKFKQAFDSDETRQICIDIINLCDEVTVTCEFMRDLYREKTGKREITVLPNFVPYFWMGHCYDKKKIFRNYDTHKRKPRIVYTGSGAHYDVNNVVGGKDDFADILQLVVDTREKYQWVFVGAFPPPLASYVRSGQIEFHNWQTLCHYPKFIENLNAQLFIAPLQNNDFNKSKSDIKFIESCVLGIPSLVQNIETYYTAPREYRFDTADELKHKIDMMLNYKNRSKYYTSVPNLRAIGESRFLESEENIGCHMEALMTNYGAPNRPYLSRFNKEL